MGKHQCFIDSPASPTPLRSRQRLSRPRTDVQAMSRFVDLSFYTALSDESLQKRRRKSGRRRKRSFSKGRKLPSRILYTDHSLRLSDWATLTRTTLARYGDIRKHMKQTWLRCERNRCIPKANSRN